MSPRHLNNCGEEEVSDVLTELLVIQSTSIFVEL